MDNKLKTLKDLNWEQNSNKMNCIELKNEVIKWIKELENFQKINYIEFGIGDEKCEWRINGKLCNDKELIDKYSVLTSFHPDVTKWIKYFFNISNESLK